MRRIWMLVGILVLCTVSGWGYTINLLTYGQPYTLYNTGVNNSGVALSGTAVDPHYTDNDWAGNNSTWTARHSAWRSDITSGTNQVRWISPTSSAGNVPHGTIYFYTGFTLPNTFPSWNVTMSALVWADNDPNSMSLLAGGPGGSVLTSVPLPQPPGGGEFGYRGPGSSGVTCPGNPTCYGGGPTTLSYDGLVGGRTYTIRFEVINQGASPNPAGLWVQWQSASALGVPEPGSYALLGTVGLALYLLRRRKSKEAKG